MQDVGSMENTGASKGPQLSDGESSLLNPLDTVSLLETGLHSCITLQLVGTSHGSRKIFPDLLLHCSSCVKKPINTGSVSRKALSGKP